MHRTGQAINVQFATHFSSRYRKLLTDSLRNIHILSRWWKEGWRSYATTKKYSAKSQFPGSRRMNTRNGNVKNQLCSRETLKARMKITKRLLLLCLTLALIIGRRAFVPNDSLDLFFFPSACCKITSVCCVPRLARLS